MHSLPDLPEQQRRFGLALMQGLDAETTAMFDGAAAEIERRFVAYQRNFKAGHFHALADTYRTVAMLLGPALFRQLAGDYIATHPSRCSDLNLYGEDFGDFLAAQPIGRELPYLPDMARLEWALLAAASAADAPVVDLGALAAVPPERQGELRLVLHPSLMLLPSDYPIASIWHAHRIEVEDERDAMLATIDLTPRTRWTLAARAANGSVEPVALSAGTAAFCTACKSGAPLESALGQACAAEPELKVSELLAGWINKGWICGFQTCS